MYIFTHDGNQYISFERRVGDNTNYCQGYVIITEAKHFLLRLRDYYYGVRPLVWSFEFFSKFC